MPSRRTHYIHEACSLDRPLYSGVWTLDEPNPVGTHLHDTLEILWSRRPMEVIAEGRRHRLRPGALQLVAPGVAHRVAARGPGAVGDRLPGCHLAIHEGYLGQAALTWRTATISAAHARIIRPLILHLVERLTTTPGVLGPECRLIACGLLGLLRDLGYATPRLPAQLPGPVRKALDLIEARGLDPSLDVRQLSAAAGLSPVHFRRLFRRVTDCAPHAYLTAFRLERARFALIAGRRTMAAVAQDSGFGSVSALCRAYRRRYGQPPRSAMAGSLR